MRVSRGFVLALLMVAACGPLPQPFEHNAQGSAYPLAELAIDVRVAPIAGLSAPTGEALARAVAENLGAYGVTATSRPGTASRFVLQGVYAGPAAETSTDTTILWTLFDADGEPTGIHAQAVEGPFAADPGAIWSAGQQPAKALAALVGADAELPATGSNVHRGVFLAEIAGAPGDGNTALATALRHALEGGPFGLAETAGDATHVVRGIVTADPPKDGNQRIAIEWHVTTPDGREVGEANQENTIPAGRLDRRWGGIAGLAAQAAAEGITEILQRVGDGGASPRGRPPIVLPPSSDLPPPAGP
ncbi:MAG: hypothetical protein IH626_07410 [Rhodospirillales bacterium]|nr:hypothetical protein [Rhodospirillales bacterium]